MSTSPAEQVDEVPVEFDLDPSRSTIVGLWGGKGKGKSHAAGRLYRAWPRDKLVIDISGDAKPGEDAEKIREPEHVFPVQHDMDRPHYRNLHYRADPGSPTYRDDVDRAAGMALRPADRACLLWVDEMGEVFPVNQRDRAPNMRRMLMASRHYGPSSLLQCGPRPKNIDPLCIQQSDYTYLFARLNPKDVEVLAENMGFPARELEAAYRANRARGDFAFLLWCADLEVLLDCPPLPYP